MVTAVHIVVQGRVVNGHVHRDGCAARCSLLALSIGDGKGSLAGSGGAHRKRFEELTADTAERVSEIDSGDGVGECITGETRIDRLAARRS